MQHGGKTYSYSVGSDVIRDGMYVEVSGPPGDTDEILEIFYSDVSHEMSVTLYREDVPLEIVEWAISIARQRLPARAEGTD